MPSGWTESGALSWGEQVPLNFLIKSKRKRKSERENEKECIEEMRERESENTERGPLAVDWHLPGSDTKHS